MIKGLCVDSTRALWTTFCFRFSYSAVIIYSIFSITVLAQCVCAAQCVCVCEVGLCPFPRYLRVQFSRNSSLTSRILFFFVWFCFLCFVGLFSWFLFVRFKKKNYVTADKAGEIISFSDFL